MKVHLMFNDDDFDSGRREPWNGPDLIQDLQLDTVFSAMASGDKFLHAVAKSAFLSAFDNSPETIAYRQEVLKDCLKNTSTVTDMYNLAVDALERRKRSYWGSEVSRYPRSILAGALETLQIFVGTLRSLRGIADESRDKFESQGFTELFARIETEISNDYLEEVWNRITELKSLEGLLIGARLGKGNKGTDYVLKRADRAGNWFQRVFGGGEESHTFHVTLSDGVAAKQLAELESRGINLVANALAQSAEHISDFLSALQTELAFYLGCANLRDRLAQLGEPICFPTPLPDNGRKLSFRELYDASLALASRHQIVANDLETPNGSLVIVTGANKGGKTCFLRSVGTAQIMMQCGMFVPANSFSSSLCAGVFTHFKRKEDPTMESGKLDEELRRMSEIADHLRTNSLVLFNEAFAATNEREGSEIARQITAALIEKMVRVFFVTHLYRFGSQLYGEQEDGVLFLRAQRNEDGTRTYKMTEGAPEQTSYGMDLYDKIFLANEGTASIRRS